MWSQKILSPNNTFFGSTGCLMALLILPSQEILQFLLLFISVLALHAVSCASTMLHMLLFVFYGLMLVFSQFLLVFSSWYSVYSHVQIGLRGVFMVLVPDKPLVFLKNHSFSEYELQNYKFLQEKKYMLK